MFRMGDRPLGEEVKLDGQPSFQVLVQGTGSLKLVQIVRDGGFIHTVRPDGDSCRFDFTDSEPPARGGSWYYVRCEQHNEEYAWSSAIWVDRGK